MGKISIKFIANGKDLFQEGSSFEESAKAQYFQRKYCLRKIQKIETEDEILLEIDIDGIQNDIPWKSFTQLSPTIIENINEIQYYHEIYSQLTEIISDLENCRFEERYEIKNLGEQALIIVKNIKESKFDKNLKIYNNLEVEGLSYTVNQKEVDFLLNYIKPKDSKRKKDEAVSAAVNQLVHEIYVVTLYLNDYR